MYSHDILNQLAQDYDTLSTAYLSYDIATIQAKLDQVAYNISNENFVKPWATDVSIRLMYDGSIMIMDMNEYGRGYAVNPGQTFGFDLKVAFVANLKYPLDSVIAKVLIAISPVKGKVYPLVSEYPNLGVCIITKPDLNWDVIHQRLTHGMSQYYDNTSLSIAYYQSLNKIEIGYFDWEAMGLCTSYQVITIGQYMRIVTERLKEVGCAMMSIIDIKEPTYDPFSFDPYLTKASNPFNKTITFIKYDRTATKDISLDDLPNTKIICYGDSLGLSEGVLCRSIKEIGESKGLTVDSPIEHTIRLVDLFERSKG